MAVFFENYDAVAQRLRTARYADAMAKLHAKYPSDSEASTFYALALFEAVDLSDKTYASQLKAAAILEQLETAQPEHPGIVHYLIHSYDYAPIAERGLPAARRYAALASSAPHAVHMPSHFFSTLGMWQEAIDSNVAADAANIAYAQSVNPAAATNPAAVAARYHALDFLVNAYLQLAQDNRAKAIVDQRDSIAVMPAGERITNHTAYAAIPVRYAIERGAWAEAAALEPMTTPYKEAEAIVWFGRALGAARSGDSAGAKKDLAELARLHQEIATTGDPYWAEQVGIPQAAATAWVALAEKQPARAIAAMQDAADREDRTEKNVAMENRLSPMRELLGELLLEAGKPAEAVPQFERSLETVPNRARSLDGAARAAAQSGNRTLAVSYFKRLLALTANADADRPALRAARDYIDANGR
jgi:predicted Zn-dependent protease